MERILYVFGRLNRVPGYVQGMNELVAILYYTYYTDHMDHDDDIDDGMWGSCDCIFYVFIKTFNNVLL